MHVPVYEPLTPGCNVSIPGVYSNIKIWEYFPMYFQGIVLDPFHPQQNNTHRRMMRCSKLPDFLRLLLLELLWSPLSRWLSVRKSLGEGQAAGGRLRVLLATFTLKKCALRSGSIAANQSIHGHEMCNDCSNLHLCLVEQIRVFPYNPGLRGVCTL